MKEKEHLISYKNGELLVPDKPFIGFIEGDGIGPDIWKATRSILDKAVKLSYNDHRKIIWKELLAGEKAYEETGMYLPETTIADLRKYRIGIKGPLTTPVGGGYRSLNVTLRQVLDLYACIRPVRHINGVPTPVKSPEKVNMVVFRENTEDVYAGYEWKASSAEVKKVKQFFHKEMNIAIKGECGIGLKPISKEATYRITRMAIRYAIKENLPSITVVHKGNIMKYTEGAFKEWAFELAKNEFKDEIVIEGEVNHSNKIVLKDRIADMMFQQILLRPEEYHLILTTNLNGDYLSDALAAQVGGLGMAPGANVGDGYALFEATHGSAPKYKNMDRVNPTSLILSGAMMLKYMGWLEAAHLVERSVEATISKKNVTYDLARQMNTATEVSCSAFGKLIEEEMDTQIDLL